MTISGLNLIFRNSIKTLRSSGIKNGAKEILKGVRQEGGKTSSVFCGIGFATSILTPATIVTAPILGYTGAVTGRLLSLGAKKCVKFAQKGINYIT